jgi:hypothetical protein
MSTVEIFVIPPFFAAVLILASASKNKIPRKPVAVEVPTLLPTGLLVALTGRIIEHPEINVPSAIIAMIDLIFLNILLSFIYAYSYGFSAFCPFFKFGLFLGG